MKRSLSIFNALLLPYEIMQGFPGFVALD